VKRVRRGEGCGEGGIEQKQEDRIYMKEVQRSENNKYDGLKGV
jgi:hypothetical protein